MPKGDDLQQFFADLTEPVNSAVADFAAKGCAAFGRRRVRLFFPLKVRGKVTQ
jgi:hypothetical protein